MPKYRVEIFETACHTIYIDAEDNVAARTNAIHAIDERLWDLYSTEWLEEYDPYVYEITDEEFDNA